MAVRSTSSATLRGCNSVCFLCSLPRTDQESRSEGASFLWALTCRWRTGCRPGPRRRSAPGPPGSGSGPATGGGSWKLWQTRGSPPGWPRPPRWGRSAGLQRKKVALLYLIFCRVERPQNKYVRPWSPLNFREREKKKKPAPGSELIIPGWPGAVKCLWCFWRINSSEVWTQPCHGSDLQV